MRCSKCGAENPDRAKFCVECASRFPRRCPSCNAENPSTAKFCLECAKPLEAETAPVEPSASSRRSEGGERRHLTVLFSDLVNSTEIAARLDPEEWREIVAWYHRATGDAVAQFGGHVAQYLGDGVMAFFGYPQAHDDDAERAVRAGLAILEAISETNDTPVGGHKVELAVRVGIHTGQVVMDEGDQGISAFGDVPNIASRVQTAAAPNTTLITAPVLQLVSGLFVVEDRGTQTLKGVPEPVQLCRVLRSSGVRGRLRTSASRGLTPFVGRDDELRLLMNRWELAREGEGQVVLITGEAGIGKSRLVRQFQEQLSSSSHRWIQAEFSPYLQQTPFASTADVIHQGFNWSGVESVEEKLDRLDENIALAGLKPAEAVPLIAPLLNLPVPDKYPPLPLSPDQQRKRLLATIVGLLLGTTRTQPLVMVLEDLQWADPSSLELQQLTVEQNATAPMLLLCTARPEFRAPWPMRAHHAQIALNRLSRSQAHEMVTRVAASEVFPKDVLDTVVERTSGVPLFVEELTRALLEGGPAEAERSIPATLQDSLMARLDRLGSAKEVAQLAAVIGREFSYKLVSDTSPLNDVELQAALAKLVDAELTYVRGVPPDATYTFKHALIQDAAYDALLKTRRKELHRIVANALEKNFPSVVDAQPALLAHHWTAGADVEKTIEYSIRAGSAAYAVLAFEEAGAHWQAALELMDEQGGGDPKQRAQLLWLLGDELVSDSAAAVGHMEAAALLFEELGDNKAACEVHLRIGLYLSTGNVARRDMRRAMPHFTKAESFLATQPESARHALFYICMASVHLSTMRICDGLAAGKRAMEISELLDLDALWSSAAVVTSQFLLHSGSVSKSLLLADEARRRAVPIQDTLTGSTVAWIGGINYFILADPREAQEWYTHELAKPRTARSANRRAILQHYLADAFIAMGRLTEARAYLAEANTEGKPEVPFSSSEATLLFFEGQWELAVKTLTAEAEGARRSGNRSGDLFVQIALARLRKVTGERAQALQILQKALDTSLEGGNILAELNTRFTLATIIADAGDAGEALSHIQRCRQIVGAGENWLGLAGSVQLAEAVVAAAQREYPAAETQFQKAIAIFQHYCLPWSQADTLQYWGRALLAAGERERAIEKFDAAIEIYRSRGAGGRFIEYVAADKKRAQDSK